MFIRQSRVFEPCVHRYLQEQLAEIPDVTHDKSVTDAASASAEELEAIKQPNALEYSVPPAADPDPFAYAEATRILDL